MRRQGHGAAVGPVGLVGQLVGLEKARARAVASWSASTRRSASRGVAIRARRGLALPHHGQGAHVADRPHQVLDDLHVVLGGPVHGEAGAVGHGEVSSRSGSSPRVSCSAFHSTSVM